MTYKVCPWFEHAVWSCLQRWAEEPHPSSTQLESTVSCISVELCSAFPSEWHNMEKGKIDHMLYPIAGKYSHEGGFSTLYESATMWEKIQSLSQQNFQQSTQNNMVREGMTQASAIRFSEGIGKFTSLFFLKQSRSGCPFPLPVGWGSPCRTCSQCDWLTVISLAFLCDRCAVTLPQGRPAHTRH